MPRANPLGVNEERDRVIEFFQDRPRDFVLRFPAVIERDDGALGRDRFLAASPGEEILHRNNGDALVLQLLHLRFERLRRDLRIRGPDVIDETVVTQNHGLRVLIDDGFGRSRRSRRSGGGRRGRRRPRGGGGGGSAWVWVC